MTICPDCRDHPICRVPIAIGLKPRTVCIPSGQLPGELGFVQLFALPEQEA